MSLSIRSFTVAAALVASATAASAGGLTVPFNAFQADSVQAFSDQALKSFALRFIGVTVTPKGNATASPTVTGAYVLPITHITLQGLKIASGQAKGSALLITRENDDGVVVGFTLANFSINYLTKQVLADTTPLGSTTTVPQLPLYNFNTATPLALKYKFPLTITGHEVLDKLFLTTEAKAVFMNSLQLPLVAQGLLDTTDFGTLTQDISTKFRKAAVPNKPYVPAP